MVLAFAALTAAGTAVASPAWAPPAPPAGTVTADGALAFTAKGGNFNDLQATRVNATTVDLDDERPIITRGDCWHPDRSDATVARCTVGPNAEVVLRTGAGDDTVTLHGDDCGWKVYLGDGDDVVDTLDVTCDGTWVAGNAGKDLMLSGTSDELFDGGGDDDTLSYAGARTPAAPVIIDMTVAGGGATLGEDHYDEVENMIGTDLDDTIIGDIQENDLDGGDGEDTISGGDGADTLVGGGGDDTIAGGGMDDLLFGEAGADALDGGPQFDACHPGADGGTETNCEL
jgi:Ca2+-binding RTX toxin-like protein